MEERETGMGVEQDFLSQEEVDSLLKGVAGNDTYDIPAITLRQAECKLAYWQGVVDALTRKIKIQ